jgi:hypothetical protein
VVPTANRKVSLRDLLTLGVGATGFEPVTSAV